MNVLFWDPGDFPVSYTNRDTYLIERSKSSLWTFYGQYWGLIQQNEVSLSRMLNDILTLDQLQWLPNWSLSTNFMTLIPSLTFAESRNRVSMELCNGYGMPAGNAYPFFFAFLFIIAEMLKSFWTCQSFGLILKILSVRTIKYAAEILNFCQSEWNFVSQILRSDTFRYHCHCIVFALSSLLIYLRSVCLSMIFILLNYIMLNFCSLFASMRCFKIFS